MIRNQNWLFLSITVIAIASCLRLYLKEYGGDISSDELFTSERLSYRFKNDILTDQTAKESQEKELNTKKKISTVKKQKPTVV